jgi:hypothetical protein
MTSDLKPSPMAVKHPHLVVGWREYIALPRFGILNMVGKVDTGAKTSSLHAEKIEEFEKDGALWVRFVTHPIARKKVPEIACEAKVLEKRTVKSSNGTQQERYVIVTQLCIGGYQWPIDVTLATRKAMGHRLLLGRSALASHVLVNPLRDFLLGPPRPEHALQVTNKRIKLDPSHV